MRFALVPQLKSHPPLKRDIPVKVNPNSADVMFNLIIIKIRFQRGR